MIEYLKQEGTRVCDQIFAYSKKRKQSINVFKTEVEQVIIPVLILLCLYSSTKTKCFALLFEAYIK